MSKKVYKRVSFIIPELDESDKGIISKEVYRKLVKYGKLPIGDGYYKEVDGAKVYVNNELQSNIVFETDGSGIDLVTDIYRISLYPNGTAFIVDLVEGDRIDVEIPFETGITVEDKVASSFESVDGGNVGFKLYGDGDVIATVTAESDFSKTFIPIIKNWTDEGRMIWLRKDDNSLLYSILDGVFTISCSEGIISFYTSSEVDRISEAYVGDIVLNSSDYDGYLIEVVVR